MREVIEKYNTAILTAWRMLPEELRGDPALRPQLVPIERVSANAYNPNKVATPEMILLGESIRADGVTMCIVVYPMDDGWEVVDGFHRRVVCAELGREYLPVVELDRNLADRMGSTIRHNRARGKHQIDLMGQIVRTLTERGRTDDQIAEALGMTVEEMLRLRQFVGAARLLAAKEYTRAWERPGGPTDPADTE